MAGDTLEFAWAIPVKPEVLGVHLEAYDNLQPSINTLRLCNRFGRGENAFVAKLPVELIQQVEDCLFDDERAKLRRRRAKILKCWGNHCQPIDHFGTDDILEVYNQNLGGLPTVCLNCDDTHEEFANEVDECVKANVAEFTKHIYDSDVRTRWLNSHRLRVKAAVAYIEAPTDSTRGRLGQLLSILRKHFGIELWSGDIHYEIDDPKPLDEKFPAIATCLRMPEVIKVQDFMPPYLQHILGRPGGELAYAGPLVLPTQPTEKSLSRFSRAFKILDLGYEIAEPSTTTPVANNQGSIIDQPISKKHSSKETSHVQPKLTMFVRSNDESPESY